MTSELDRAMDRLLIQFEELKDAQKNARFYAEALTKEDERKSARIRELEDQLAAAREALEPFANAFHFSGFEQMTLAPDWHDMNDGTGLLMKHWRNAADVYRKLTEKAGDDGQTS